MLSDHIRTLLSHLLMPPLLMPYLSHIGKSWCYVFHWTYRNSPDWSPHWRLWLWLYFEIESMPNEVHDHMNFPQIWQNHWSFYWSLSLFQSPYRPTWFPPNKILLNHPKPHQQQHGLQLLGN